MSEEKLELQEFVQPESGVIHGTATAVFYQGIEFIIVAPDADKLNHTLDTFRVLRGKLSSEKFRDVVITERKA